jgi:hypothetical protein
MIMILVGVIAAIVFIRFAAMLLTLIGLLVILAGSLLALAVVSIGWVGVHIWQWHLLRKRDKLLRELMVPPTIELRRLSSGDFGHDDVGPR